MGIEHSQNYLHSKQLVATLLSKSNICNDDIVIEIGPGKGIIKLGRHENREHHRALRYRLEICEELLRGIPGR